MGPKVAGARLAERHTAARFGMDFSCGWVDLCRGVYFPEAVVNGQRWRTKADVKPAEIA
jgi:hypothetical protein